MSDAPAKPAEPLRFAMPGVLEEVPKARHKVATWLSKAGAPKRVANEIGLALTEVCNNAIEHGTATKTRPMHLTAAIEGGIVAIEFLGDHGGSAQRLDESFTWAALPDSGHDRGRGLYLIRAYVDELIVDSTRDGRLRIRLLKRLPK
ncbi:MAG TPA: ATP-binding protein [Planctomycetota bacterium]|nr:ATP-binding protein [Planctomycetota bacterium]